MTLHTSYVFIDKWLRPISHVFPIKNVCQRYICSTAWHQNFKSFMHEYFTCFWCGVKELRSMTGSLLRSWENKLWWNVSGKCCRDLTVTEFQVWTVDWCSVVSWCSSKDPAKDYSIQAHTQNLNSELEKHYPAIGIH